MNMEHRQEPTEHRTKSIYAPFLASFFRELEARDVRYCVPRNFENLPETILGDVDVLVRPGQLRRAEAALECTAPGHFVLRRVERNGHVLLWIGSATELRNAAREERAAEVLEIDLVTQLQWKGIAYQDTISVLSAARTENGIWVASEADKAAHILCHAILDKNLIKPAYRAAIAEVVGERGEQAFAPLLPFVGPEMVKVLHAAFASGGDAALLALRRDLIRSLLVSRPTAATGWLAYTAARGLRIARAIASPPGVLIATAGPDGVGKSTLLANTRTVLESTFDPVRDQYMGWREFILPTKRVLLWLQRTLQAQGRGWK